MSGPRLINLDAAAERLANELKDRSITRARLYRCAKFGSCGVYLKHFRTDRRRICLDSQTLLGDYLQYCADVADAMKSNAIPREQIAAVVDDLNYSEM